MSGIEHLKQTSTQLNSYPRTKHHYPEMEHEEGPHISTNTYSLQATLIHQEEILAENKIIEWLSQGSTESINTDTHSSAKTCSTLASDENLHRGDLLSTTCSIPVEEENMSEVSYSQFGQLTESKSDCSEDDLIIEKEVRNPLILSPGTWERKYDNLLMEMVVKYRHNWKRITRVFTERTNCKTNSKVLRQIYQKIMAEEKREKVRFSHEEDLIIVECIEKFGLNWSKISYNLEGRTPTMIKNRFYSYIKKRGKYEEYLREIEQRRLQSEMLDTTSVGMKSMALKIWPEENETLPIFNQTFYEINMPHPEDLLSTKIFSSY